MLRPVPIPRIETDLHSNAIPDLRAGRLADVAVREAYRRQVPPALVFGVLLTENTELKTKLLRSCVRNFRRTR